MPYEINVAENSEVFEVYNREIFDQAPLDPERVQALVKLEIQARVKEMLTQLLMRQVEEQIQAARYEHGAQRRQDYRNGYYQRELSTTFGRFSLRVPRARQMRLNYGIFAAYQRRWSEIDRLFLEAFIGGMSCRGVADRLAPLLGMECSGATVAGLTEALDKAVQDFRMCPLSDEYQALVMDGMYLRIKQCGPQKRPVVAVIGLRPDGQMDLLAFRVCYSENALEVEALVRSLKERGLKGMHLQTMTLDGDKGLEAAALAVYPYVRIQDCVFHRINRLHQNALSKKRGRQMMREASKAFAAPSVREQQYALRGFCAKWKAVEPQAIERFEDRLDRCFEVSALPLALRTKASTTSVCENLFRQLRLRTNAIGAFENPRSVDRFVFALVKCKQWIHLPGIIPNSPLIKSTHNN